MSAGHGHASRRAQRYEISHVHLGTWRPATRLYDSRILDGRCWRSTGDHVRPRRRIASLARRRQFGVRWRWHDGGARLPGRRRNGYGISLDGSRACRCAGGTSGSAPQGRTRWLSPFRTVERAGGTSIFHVIYAGGLPYGAKGYNGRLSAISRRWWRTWRDAFLLYRFAPRRNAQRAIRRLVENLGARATTIDFV